MLATIKPQPGTVRQLVVVLSDGSRILRHWKSYFLLTVRYKKPDKVRLCPACISELCIVKINSR